MAWLGIRAVPNTKSAQRRVIQHATPITFRHARPNAQIVTLFPRSTSIRSHSLARIPWTAIEATSFVRPTGSSRHVEVIIEMFKHHEIRELFAARMAPMTRDTKR